MSTALLPPMPLGPVYPISPSLHVTGIFPGVTIAISGSKSGSLASTIYQGTDPAPWVLFTKQPVAGEYIIVEQTPSTGAGSGPSPSNNVQVIPVPTPLPNPLIVEPLNLCSDVIALDSLIPGAELLVLVNGATIVQEQIQTPAQTFNLNPAVHFAIGDVFHVSQSWQKLSSGITLSLPIESLGLSNPLPYPDIDPSPVACTSEATFKNLIVGASIYVTNGPDWYSAAGVAGGTQEITWGGPPFVAGPMTVKQYFARCNLNSTAHASTVSPAPPLAAPIIDTGFCEKSTLFHLSGLNVPAEVKVTRYVSGRPDLAATRSWMASTADVEMPIPSDWALTSPGSTVSFSFMQSTSCGASPWSANLTLQSSATNPKAPIVVSPLYACAHFIQIQQAVPDCEMQAVTSSGEPLSDIFTVTTPNFILHTDSLYFPLFAGESLLVVQKGCGADLSSAAVVVSAAPSPVPPPSIKNVLRPGDTQLQVGNVIPGAEVIALVDGKYFGGNYQLWAPEVEALSNTVTLTGSSPLVADQSVLAAQEICGIYSALNGSSAVAVQKATLTVSAIPSALVRGQTVSFHVDAVDSQAGVTNSANWGAVSFDGQTFPLGHSVSIAIAAGNSLSSLPGTIAGTPYNNPASFSVPLITPPPPTFTFRLSGGPTFFTTEHPTLGTIAVTLQSLHWSVVSAWAGTVAVSGTQSSDYFVGTHVFTRPTSATKDTLSVTGTATFSVAGVGTFTAPVAGSFTRAVSDTSATSCIGWLLSFSYPDDGNGDYIFEWGNGQKGNSVTDVPTCNPFGYTC